MFPKTTTVYKNYAAALPSGQNYIAVRVSDHSISELKEFAALVRPIHPNIAVFLEMGHAFNRVGNVDLTVYVPAEDSQTYGD